MPEPDLEFEHPELLFVYFLYECPVCGYISVEQNPGIPCAHCGDVGQHRAHYPRLTAVSFLQMAALEYIKKQDARAHALCIFHVCTALEVLLDDLLRRLIEAQDPDCPPWIVESAIPDSVNRAISQTFKNAVGMTLTEASAAVGHGSFAQKWEVARRVRNRFAHGQSDRATPQEANMAAELAREAIAVFAALINRFVVNHPQSRDHPLPL